MGNSRVFYPMDLDLYTIKFNYFVFLFEKK